MKILVGANNENKFAQYIRVFSKYMPEVEVFSLTDFQISDDIDENADSLEENAKDKAKFYGDKAGVTTVSDDTGLFVDALDGAPGLHAKRWHDGTELDRCRKILERLRGLPLEKRSACYDSVLAIYNPKSGKFWTFPSKIEGWIVDEFKGGNGFGYDSIFLTKDYPGKHYAELTTEQIDAINHRGKGLKKFAEFIKNNNF